MLKNFPKEDELMQFLSPLSSAFSFRQLDNFWLLNRPGGYDIHPTNLGHSLIAAEFAKVWKGLQ